MKRMALHRRRRHSRRNYRRRRYHGRGRLTVLIRFLSFLLICSAIAGALILFFRVQAFVVSGNRRYTEQEIIDSTGVELGDNMYLLNKYAISREITTRLPGLTRAWMAMFSPCVALKVKTTCSGEGT